MASHATFTCRSDTTSTETAEYLRKVQAACRSRAIGDKDEFVQNVHMRLYAAAAEANLDVYKMLTDAPQMLKRAVEAERSQVRRDFEHQALSLERDLSGVLPAEEVPSIDDLVELLEAVFQRVRLTARERRYLQLKLQSVEDVEVIARDLGVRVEEVYRLGSEARKKLSEVAEHVFELM